MDRIYLIIATLPGIRQFRIKTGIFITCLVVKLDLTQKIYHINKFFLSSQKKTFLLKNTIRVT